MQRRPKESNKTDQKNVYCPHYSRCLDEAAKEYWHSWDCSGCAYKSTVQPLKIDQGAGGLSLYGEVPSQICRRVRSITSGAA